MTKLVEFGAPTSIENQARKWLIRMDGDEPLTEAEKVSLGEWMGRSPAHRSELIRLAKFWDDANILTELAGATFAVDPQADGHFRNSGWIPRILLALSAVIATVTATYTGIRQLGGSFTRVYETAVGEEKTVVLSDGSTVQLNTDSQVEINYGPNSRIVRLMRGEVHVSASYDAQRVFEVQVAHSLVRARGTSFDVYVEEQSVEVMVTTGLVEIVDCANGTTASDKGSLRGSRESKSGDLANTVRVKAGEIASFSSGSGVMPVRQLTDTEIQRRLSWQEGYLTFSGEPLSAVVKALNRYSTVKLEIGDPKLASVAVGGSFQLGDVSAAIDLLRDACGVRAERINANTIRLESR